MIGLIDYGAGNLRSLEFALDALDRPYRRVREPSELAGLRGLVLPGVGAAEFAMRELRRLELVAPLRERSLPLLGVCLGMQLLGEWSDEGEDRVSCLRLLGATTQRFPAGVTVPHNGWNEVGLEDDPLFAGLASREHFYFLHGYRVVGAPAATIGWASHGERFSAAIRTEAVTGVQFHPEKSGRAGLRVLANFCDSC